MSDSRTARDLIRENDLVVGLLASLTAEERRLEAEIKALHAPHGSDFATTPEAVLQAQLASVREQLASRHADRARLQEALTKCLLDIHRQNEDLASLFMASQQLHRTRDRAEVAARALDVLSLVGGQKVALFELTEDHQGLRLTATAPLGCFPDTAVPMGEGTIGRAAVQGVTLVAGRRDEEDAFLAVPLRVVGRVTGVMAVFLDEKNREGVDRTLVEQLGSHVAMALHWADLFEKTGVSEGGW
jgi:nitrate/nitrite-specific signal transduction histidine kinase